MKDLVSFLPIISQQASSARQSQRLALPSEPELSELCIAVLWLATELKKLPSEKVSNLLPQTRMELAKSLEKLYFEIWLRPMGLNTSSPSLETSSDQGKRTMIRSGEYHPL
jgi:hypothetical protein